MIYSEWCTELSNRLKDSGEIRMTRRELACMELAMIVNKFPTIPYATACDGERTFDGHKIIIIEE